MASVAARVKQISKTQPYGGYVPVSMFERVKFTDEARIYPNENISGSLTGTVVDYLTRFMTGTQKEQAFILPMMGAVIPDKYVHGELEAAKSLFSGITGLDDVSIENACKLSTFDRWIMEPPILAMFQEGHESIVVQSDSGKNIRTFVERSINFFTKYGPVLKSGYMFPPDSPACTSEVDSGIMDYLTADTIWDMKCYRPSTKISKDDTLQVLMYWIMGQHSGQEIFSGITKIGLYNPRFNVAYTLDVAKIPASVIREVEEKVICY